MESRRPPVRTNSTPRILPKIAPKNLLTKPFKRHRQIRRATIAQPRTALIESRLYSFLTDPAVIADLRERLCLSTTIIAQVVLKENIQTNTDNLSAMTTCIEEITTHIADVTNRVARQTATIDNEIDKAVDKNVQVGFSEAVGSQQIKKIETHATVDIMEKNDYVKTLGTEIVNNEHV